MKIAKKHPVLAVLGVLFVAGCFPARADDGSQKISGQELVNAATKTIENFVADPKMDNFRADLKRAHAVMIVPKWTRAGLIVGGSGGNGVVLVRSGDNWHGPAFYEYGGGSVGAQIGVSVQQVVMLVVQEKAVSRLLQGKVRLGGGVSVAAGKAGTAQEVGSTKATADENVDIVSYGKAKGLYAGLVAEGATMQMLDSVTSDYYGKSVTANDILMTAAVSNEKAAALKDLLVRNSR